MNIKSLLFVTLLFTALTGCNGGGDGYLKARDNGGGQKPPGPIDNKPTDPMTGKINEKLIALILQVPTTIESEFLNVMELDLTNAEKAVFSFSYAPEKNGVLYFSLAQSKLHIKGCANNEERDFDANVFWYEVTGNKRVFLKKLDHDITAFQFSGGKRYILSYALLDLKKDFSDCKAANLKFAAFLQDYN